MTTPNYFSKSIGFACAALLSSTCLFAQVKIGSSPTTIGPNNNLEVESTGGQKTFIHKTTGQVTIADGTQGTGKVFTSDAVGGGSWQSSKLVQAAINYINDGVVTVPPYPSLMVFGNIQITFPENGTYVVDFSFIGATLNTAQFFPAGPNATNWIRVGLFTPGGAAVLNHQDNLIPGSPFVFVSSSRYVNITNAPVTLHVGYQNASDIPFTIRPHSTNNYNDWFAYKVF